MRLRVVKSRPCPACPATLCLPCMPCPPGLVTMARVNVMALQAAPVRPLCFLVAAAIAQPLDALPEQVVITGSVADAAAAEAPYAISVIDAATLRSSGPLINLSEAMARVPGLVVANRNNTPGPADQLARLWRPGPASACAGCACTPMASRRRCPMARARWPLRPRRRAAHRGLARDVLGALRRQLGQRHRAVSAPARAGGVRHRRRRRPAARPAPVARPRQRRSRRRLRTCARRRVGPGMRRALARTARRSKRLPTCRLACQVDARYGGRARQRPRPAGRRPAGPDSAQFDADPYQTTPQAAQFNTRKTATPSAGRRAPGAIASPTPGRLARERGHGLLPGERAVTQWQAIAAGHASQPAPRRRRHRPRPRLQRRRTPGCPGAGRHATC